MFNLSVEVFFSEKLNSVKSGDYEIRVIRKFSLGFGT